jgi:hypothetical protein
MRKLLLAAGAFAALSATPAFAGEGTFQQGEVASGFMARMMGSAMQAHRAGTSFQFATPSGSYGDFTGMPASGFGSVGGSTGRLVIQFDNSTRTTG